ncbi:hypothetical protein PN36_23780, partial [Candidatus Thiomargarita nelsonii]
MKHRTFSQYFGWVFKITLLWLFCFQTVQGEPYKIALVNQDNYRIIKFAYGGVNSRAYGEVVDTSDGRGAEGGYANPANWSGVGTQPDFIGTILSNADYQVDYFTSDTLPTISPTDYNVVIIQDPLKDNNRGFDRSVLQQGSELPDLLEHTTSEAFWSKILGYFNAGGGVVLVGDAVRLLEKLDISIKTDETANTLSEPLEGKPSKWLFINGWPFCGTDRNGSGTYQVESSVLLAPGTKLADLKLFSGNDKGGGEAIWSDTVYYPVNGVSLLDVRVQGSSEYPLNHKVCNPPVGKVIVDDVLTHFMGYTIHDSKKIFYIGNDSFFDYKLRDHRGAWHAKSFLEMKYTTTEAGQQLILKLVEQVLNYSTETCIPSIEIDLNSNNRVTGDKVVVNAHIKGPKGSVSSCEPTQVVETVWVKLPNDAVIPLIEPFTGLTLLPGDDIDTKIFEYTFSGAEPIGAYQIGGRLLH